MNLLGFVAALLLMLSLFIASLCQEANRTSKLQSSYLSYCNAARSAQNQFEFAYYKSLRKPRAKTEEQNTQPAEKNPLANKEKTKQEKWENMPECARLNIFSLLQGSDQKSSERYKLFQKILHTLYKSASADPLIEQMILAAHEKKEDLFLSQIKLKDPSLQSLFYHMLKGSNAHAKESYPSLLDYIKIDPDEAKEKICLACADLAMLTALFGEKTAKKLCQEKTHPMERLSLTKAELEQILLHENQPLPVEDFWNLVRFSHPKKKNTTITLNGHGDHLTFKKQCYLPDAHLEE